jgi:hypothetical protein
MADTLATLYIISNILYCELKKGKSSANFKLN